MTSNQLSFQAAKVWLQGYSSNLKNKLISGWGKQEDKPDSLLYFYTNQCFRPDLLV
jgi:hypothetical protein